MENEFESSSPAERTKQGSLYRWAAPLCIVICVLIFYWRPLFSSSTTIQGDTADVHLPLLKFFSERLFSGHLPFWCPYIYSGYPAMANPLMGAWYPLNWPMFLMGVTPLALQIQLAVHAALACLGTYFLLSILVQRRGAALVGAFAYGFSGFFASNSSQLAVFMTAAWFPWLLYSYLRAAEGQRQRFTAIGALVGGMMILCGHTQTACFGFVGLVFFGLAHWAAKRVSFLRNAGILLSLILGALAVSAVQSLPAWELSRVAAAPSAAATTAGNGVLDPDMLMTALWPDWTGTISKSRPDLFNHGYFYAGLLLIPLALFGLAVTSHRLPALVLIVPTIWFMLGPPAGLYRLGAILPGAQSGPPVLAWFVAALGLAMLVATGCDWIFNRGRRVAAIGVVAAGFLFGDLLYWNSVANPLAYSRQSYAERYGRPETLGRQFLAVPQISLYRFDSPYSILGAGPTLGPLDMKLEATYGYLLRESAYYREYRAAMERNTHLRDGLNASRFLNVQAQGVDVNPTVLPRVYFPPSIRDVSTDDESRKALENLDPTEQSIVMTPHEVIEQDKGAGGIVTSFNEQSYHIHYAAQSSSLMRLSVPWYPGWRAKIASRTVPLLRVDHALMGVVVPAGEHDVDLEYFSRFFYTGLVISVFCTVLWMLMAFGGGLRRRVDRMFFPHSTRRRKRGQVWQPASI